MIYHDLLYVSLFVARQHYRPRNLIVGLVHEWWLVFPLVFHVIDYDLVAHQHYRPRNLIVGLVHEWWLVFRLAFLLVFPLVFLLVFLLVFPSVFQAIDHDLVAHHSHGPWNQIHYLSAIRRRY